MPLTCCHLVIFLPNLPLKFSPSVFIFLTFYWIDCFCGQSQAKGTIEIIGLQGCFVLRLSLMRYNVIMGWILHGCSMSTDRINMLNIAKENKGKLFLCRCWALLWCSQLCEGTSKSPPNIDPCEQLLNSRHTYLSAALNGLCIPLTASGSWNRKRNRKKVHIFDLVTGFVFAVWYSRSYTNWKTGESFEVF